MRGFLNGIVRLTTVISVWLRVLAVIVTVPMPELIAQGPPPFSLVERLTFGGDGREGFEFGNIEAIAVSGDGRNVFVLDRLNHRLAAFDKTGALIDTAARVGSGPGEFRWPSAVVTDDSFAIVVDASLGRASSWVVRGNSLDLKREVTHTIFLESRAACSLDGSIVLLRYSGGKILQQVALDGTVLMSFGAPFSPEAHPMMPAATTFGYVACERRDNSIYVAGSQVPVVRRYRANGELVWEANVPGIHPPSIRPAGAGIRYSPPEGRQYAQLVVSLVPVGDSMLVVQFGDGGPDIGQPGDITRVTTVVISAGDGSVLWQGTEVPRLDLARGNQVYSQLSDPFPRVKMFEWRKRP